MLLFAVVLACSVEEAAPPAPPAPVAQPPAPVAEPPPPPEPVAPALPEAATDPSLHLGTYELEQLTAYQAAMSRLGESDEATCEAVSQALSVSGRLAGHLGARWNAADEPPHYKESIDKLSEAFPGLQLAGGAEGVYGHADLGALGRKVGKSTPSGKLLIAAHGWLGDLGKSTFLDWTTDLSGCAQLGRSAERLGAVADAWDAAPECLRRVLQQPIADDVRTLAGWDCYCMSEPEIRHDLGILGPVLDRMPELGGPEAKARIEADLAAGMTRYETHACGG